MHRADVVALALHARGTRSACRRPARAAPAGSGRGSTACSSGSDGQLLPVHVVVEVRHAAAALVGDGDPAGLAERHRPVAVARPAVGAVADHERLDLRLEAVADREEVAERRVDARRRAAVVVDAQAQQPRPAVLVVGDRHPDVRHDAGALRGPRARSSRPGSAACCRRWSSSPGCSTRSGRRRSSSAPCSRNGSGSPGLMLCESAGRAPSTNAAARVPSVRAFFMASLLTFLRAAPAEARSSSGSRSRESDSPSG